MARQDSIDENHLQRNSVLQLRHGVNAELIAAQVDSVSQRALDAWATDGGQSRPQREVAKRMRRTSIIRAESQVSTELARRALRSLDAASIMNVSHTDIARRAYEIYLRAGMTDGGCARHWYRAEYELRRQRIRDALMVELRTPAIRSARRSAVLSDR